MREKKKKCLAQQKAFIKHSQNPVDTAQVHESLCHDNILHSHRTKVTVEATGEQKSLVLSPISTKKLKGNFIIMTNLGTDIKFGAKLYNTFR